MLPKRSDFQRLRRYAKEAVREAEKAGIGDAVNWAAVTVNDVSFVVDEEGETWFEVYITEASPDAYEFRRFVEDYLRARGYESVEVITEW